MSSNQTFVPESSPSKLPTRQVSRWAMLSIGLGLGMIFMTVFHHSLGLTIDHRRQVSAGEDRWMHREGNRVVVHGGGPLSEDCQHLHRQENGLSVAQFSPNVIHSNTFTQNWHGNGAPPPARTAVFLNADRVWEHVHVISMQPFNVHDKAGGTYQFVNLFRPDGTDMLLQQDGEIWREVDPEAAIAAIDAIQPREQLPTSEAMASSTPAE